MILRFRKVTDGLYRGSAPSPQDVVKLKNNFGIKKIVSLDEEAGNRIDRACKLLEINHIIIPIDIENLNLKLINFLRYDLKELFLENGPVFLHCAAGKDRSGFATALVQCKYLGKDPEDAIDEAKKLGFGIDVDPRPIALFEKIIRSCKPNKDNNSAKDIVSSEREYIGDNRDSFLQDGAQSSFAPYLSETRQYPYDSVYNENYEQTQTRENDNKSITRHKYKDIVPMVGVYNNDAGIFGAGITISPGGFIYD